MMKLISMLAVLGIFGIVGLGLFIEDKVSGDAESFFAYMGLAMGGYVFTFTIIIGWVYRPWGPRGDVSHE